MSRLDEQDMQRVHDTLVNAAWATPPQRARAALRELAAHYEADDWEELDCPDEVYHPVALSDLAPIMTDEQVVEWKLGREHFVVESATEPEFLIFSPLGDVRPTNADRLAYFWEQVQQILDGDGDADVYPACSLLTLEHSDGRTAVVEHACRGYSFSEIIHELRGPYRDETDALEAHGDGTFPELEDGSLADEVILGRWERE